MIFANANDSTLDTTVPTVTITGPTSSPTYIAGTVSSVTVSGSASDPAGIAICRWSNALTGQSGNATTTGNGAWSAVIPLSLGDNAITITGLDPGGNQGTDVITVTRSATVTAAIPVGRLVHTGRIGTISIAPTSGATPLRASWAFDNFTVDRYEYQSLPATGANFWTEANLGTAGDGLTTSGGWVCYGYPQGDVVTTGASRSGAVGDRGFRHHIVYDQNTLSGHNQVGGGIAIDFTVPAVGGPFRELWLQWWMRWGVGIHPANVAISYQGPGTGAWSFTKDMDFNDRGEAIGRVSIGNNGGGGGLWGGVVVFVGSQPHLATTVTWADQNGGSSMGAGIWNKWQVHLKADNGLGSNGTWEAWFNGTLVSQNFAVNYSGGNPSWVGWSSVRPGINGSQVGSDSPIGTSYVEYDDIKLSTVGYITQD